MKYIDISKLITSYKQGKNILKIINSNYDSCTNSAEAIEIAYDLQAGSYIEHYKNNPGYFKKAMSEKLKILKKFFPKVNSILDAGCGELTNTSLLFSALPNLKHFFCFDLSWSRVFVGRRFYSESVSQKLLGKTEIFCGNMLHLPLPDNSIDLITTFHAIEPNHGKEREILKELLRVSIKGLILFEPDII